MVYLPDPVPFTPIVQRPPRRNGWTPDIQQRFIAALAVAGSVIDACCHVGRSRKSAYALRHRADAAGFSAP